MLSSLGFDNKGSRNTRNGSKYVLEVPRGFSVHVFKSPSPPLPTQNATGKADYPTTRTPSVPWKPSRQDADKKSTFALTDHARREQMTEFDQLALTRSKSNKPYGIVPGAIPDTYVYERSISSMSDLPGSPSSSSSSDSDSIVGVSPYSADVSSIRASSSTETLDAITYSLSSQNRDALTAPAASSYGNSRGPVIPPSGRQALANLTNTHSSRYASADHAEGDASIIFGELSTTRVAGQTPQTHSAPPTHPSRRNSDERSGRAGAPTVPSAPILSRRDSRSRSTSPTGNTTEAEASLRLPPGLQHAAPSIYPNGLNGTLQRANSTPTVSLTPRSVPDASKPPLTRGMSNPETPAAKRSVRWTEDLICPSPVPVEHRRKGWFNRRGDQLWTNDGRYKSVEPGQEYPADLANYPEPNSGWMNEEGVRIDVYHRLIPKPPLRPALKRAKDPSRPVQEGLSTG